jgi:two-component system, cell cycle response regulator DivK
MASKRPVRTGDLSERLILLVDDFEDSRELYAEYLVFSGFRVATANDGADALKKARELRPAVILMDLTMAGIDGWEATRQLKSDTGTAAIPVIAFTAHAYKEFETRARQVGCDGFITKPCLPDELILRIQSILRQRPRTTGELV